MYEAVGSFNIPSRFGRLNAGAGMGRLRFDGETIEISARGILGIIPVLGRSAQSEIPISSVDSAYPIRTSRVPGIALLSKSGDEYYFWTHRRDEVVHVLVAAGLQFQGGEDQKAKRLWR